MNIAQNHPAMAGGRRRANVIAHQQHVPAAQPAAAPEVPPVAAEPPKPARRKLSVKAKP